MLQHSYYSVISPEGCAGILWKTANEQTKPRAATALRLTSGDLKRFGVIDDVIPEPVGGAHRSPREMGNQLKTHLVRYLRELTTQPIDELLQKRYEKFRRMGEFLAD
jgi:acetyl-CoA carboxylase carboxyl transferase subunit alpha